MDTFCCSFLFPPMIDDNICYKLFWLVTNKCGTKKIGEVSPVSNTTQHNTTGALNSMQQRRHCRGTQWHIIHTPLGKNRQSHIYVHLCYMFLDLPLQIAYVRIRSVIDQILCFCRKSAAPYYIDLQSTRIFGKRGSVNPYTRLSLGYTPPWSGFLSFRCEEFFAASAFQFRASVFWLPFIPLRIVNHD